VFESIKGSLLKGDKVTLQGFGTFEVVDIAETQRRNPRTGEKFMAPAHKAPKFKFSNSFKSLF
jgi:DNA-binding protein HU-beta